MSNDPNRDFLLVRSLLAAAMYASPDGATQERFTNMANTMRAEGESNRAIAVAISGAILDGLQHGNWPTNWPSNLERRSQANG